METTFKPMMASVKEQEFKNALLHGYGIKKDNGAHDYYDIVERNKIATSTGCVGYSKITTKAADNVLKKVLKQLEKDGYIVMAKGCSDIYKGRFKATTYYLAEE